MEKIGKLSIALYKGMCYALHMNDTIKEKLKQYIFTYYTSQKAFAKAASIDESHVSDILRGASPVGYATATKIHNITKGEVTCRDLMK